jgi:hypothetical protein
MERSPDPCKDSLDQFLTGSVLSGRSFSRLTGVRRRGEGSPGAAGHSGKRLTRGLPSTLRTTQECPGASLSMSARTALRRFVEGTAVSRSTPELCGASTDSLRSCRSHVRIMLGAPNVKRRPCSGDGIAGRLAAYASGACQLRGDYRIRIEHATRSRSAPRCTIRSCPGPGERSISLERPFSHELLHQVLNLIHSPRNHRYPTGGRRRARRRYPVLLQGAQ